MSFFQRIVTDSQTHRQSLLSAPIIQAALSGTVTQVSADAPLKALIGPLSAADVAVTGRDDVKPGKAQGMLVVTDIACTIEQVEAIHTAPNQHQLHPGSFATYLRTYGKSRDDFLARKFAKLDWVTDVTGDYGDGRLIEAVRRAPDLGAKLSPFGRALFGRSWLEAKASGADWSQDYEVDIYLQRSPGRVVHMLAVWRQASFSGFDTDSALLQNVMMSSFVTWDKEIEKHCKSGKF